MNKKIMRSIGFFATITFAIFSEANPGQNVYLDQRLILENLTYPSVEIPLPHATATISSTFTDVVLRAGYFRENKDVEFKGCVLYLEGLGDSVVNHIPMYKALSDQGYRTVFFDYFGQGGSGHTMNHTRIIDLAFPALQISHQAKFIWNHYSQVRDPETQRNCQNSKKRVVGWSTGGLATYGLAAENWADAVVLIAPGIFVNTFVGEAAKHPEYLAQLKPVITLPTLTTAPFIAGQDPHIDLVKPNTPSVVPLFAANLIISSQLAQTWLISKSTRGLVFLSGPQDTYVKAAATESVLNSNAPHFDVIKYSKALHEIDNELPEISKDFRKRMLEFFNEN